MALGKKPIRQEELFVAAAALRKGPGHPFYTKLNTVLGEAGFDPFVAALCAPHYRAGGRPGIPPGVYFRMVFVGYCEGIDRQRGSAWRCADSLGLRGFLGLPLTAATPVHASMSVIRQRLPETVFDEVFRFVLGLLEKNRLLKGKTLGIDAPTLEANAAMKSIVRKDDGKGWKDYLRKLAQAEGLEEPTAADLQRRDRSRQDKKVSHQDWESPADPDARIARMKDGPTHLAYKAEHAVDLETGAIVAATVTQADRGDGPTGAETLIVAPANLVQMGSQAEVKKLVADKGYHDNRLRAQCVAWQVRTDIPERQQKTRRWTDQPGDYEPAFRAHRRRVGGEKGKRRQRRRSEECERSFAHVCATGGGRRSWLRGTVNVAKAHVLRCAAHNLALLLRKCFGLAKPRSGAALFSLLFRRWFWMTAPIPGRRRRALPTIPGPSPDKPPFAPGPLLPKGLFFDGLLAII